MAWSEVVDKRTAFAKHWADLSNPGQYQFESRLGTVLHYSTALDGTYDGVVDMTPTRINNAQLDGWRITNAGYNYAIGKPGDKSTDGWVGFGGRRGQNWLRFRLSRVGYLHWPTRAWDDVGGSPTYTRANLTRTVIPLTVGPAGSQVSINQACKVEWRNLWVTPNSGEVYARWIVEGGQIKEEIVFTNAARQWIATNHPPATPASETFFGLVFQLDLSDIANLKKNGITNDPESDFNDDDGTVGFELADSLQRALGFMPISDAYTSDYRNKIRLRKRFWKDIDGNNYLLVGAKVSEFAALPALDIVFDPTFTDQPNAAAGNDTMILSSAPTTTNETNTAPYVGDGSGAVSEASRMLIKFDLSSITGPVTVSAASVYLTEYYKNNSGGVTSWDNELHRCRRNWVENQATWNIYSTGNSWTTAGGGDTTNDIVSTVSAFWTASGATGSRDLERTFSTAQIISDIEGFINGTFGSYGWFLTAPTAEYQGTTAYAYSHWYTSDQATVAFRPRISVTYTASGTAVQNYLQQDRLRRAS